jgi:anti-anti-sigma regulatory factor
MKKILTIIVSEIFENKINSRSSVELLFNQLIDVDKVIIDFKSIEFISRAAAHELVVNIEKHQSRGVDVTLKNVDSAINKMLDAVNVSRKSNAKKATFVQRLTFSTEQEFNAFLLSI